MDKTPEPIPAHAFMQMFAGLCRRVRVAEQCAAIVEDSLQRAFCIMQDGKSLVTEVVEGNSNTLKFTTDQVSQMIYEFHARPYPSSCTPSLSDLMWVLWATVNIWDADSHQMPPLVCTLETAPLDNNGVLYSGIISNVSQHFGESYVSGTIDKAEINSLVGRLPTIGHHNLEDEEYSNLSSWFVQIPITLRVAPSAAIEMAHEWIPIEGASQAAVAAQARQMRSNGMEVQPGMYAVGGIWTARYRRPAFSSMH